MSTIKPNRFEAAYKALSLIKGYDVEANIPNEINENEEHLTHLMFVKSTANLKTLDFEHSTKLVKLHDEALAVAKSNLMQNEGNVIVLHEGVKKTKAKKEADSGKEVDSEKMKEIESALEEEKAKNKKLEEALKKKESAEDKKAKKEADKVKQPEEPKATEEPKTTGDPEAQGNEGNK